MAVIIASFLAGYIAGIIVIVSASCKVDMQIEKRGIWTIKDRAYRLERLP